MSELSCSRRRKEADPGFQISNFKSQIAAPSPHAGGHGGKPLLWAALLAASLLLLPTLAFAHEDQKTESRTPFVHDIPLRDADGQVISLPALLEDGKLVDAKGKPFSMSETCGKCHEYAVMAKGWHFNAAMGNVKPGRPGEPWILTDPATHTQIPLSYRGWAGTFKPGDLGMSDFDFVAMFARHLPGGGVGEPEKMDAKDPNTRRMLVTGALQVDCLICHETTGRYNHEARFNILKSQDFKWAPTIAEGLGTISGFRTAKSIADSWHGNSAAPTNGVPAIKYDRARFDADNNVLLELNRRPPASACYYCHTTSTHAGDAGWHGDNDVHMRAGMTCVDCHRNSVDHMIVRGYEGEVKDRAITPDMIDLRVKLLLRDNATLTAEQAKPLAEKQLNSELGKVETLSCRGCHLGSAEGKIDDANDTPAGRLGSPLPLHKGLPPIHLEKLTCTACHSGPFPGMQEQVVHTAMAHKLGLPGPMRGEDTAPVIVEPVFLRDANGRIAPHKMVWPSYWGRMNKEGKVKPMLPEEVSKTVRLPMDNDVERDPYNSKPLTDAQIQTALEKLSADKTKDEAVFIASGKLYRLEGGALKSAENDAAKPYAWALAHDVRPARQALGARGCADCHSDHAPIYLGAIAARGPVDLAAGVNKQMWELRGDDKSVFGTFAYTFHFRPLLKVICFGSALVVLAVLLNFGLLGIGAITGRTRSKQSSSDREK